MSENEILNELITRYPILEGCKESIYEAYLLLEDCYKNGHKLLIAGNGGSAADSEHIVGELMKSFCKKRMLSRDFFEKLKTFSVDEDDASKIYNKLEGALPAIALVNHVSLTTAYGNDKEDGFTYEFAQQVYGYGNKGDVFLGISTSGNSKNVVNAAIVSKAKGLKVISLTGSNESKLSKISDVTIKAPSTITHHIQELHLPVYHCLCLMLENRFFK